MRLLKLPKYVQKLIAQGDLTAGHGKALIGLGDKELRILTDRIIEEGLSVREVEKIVKQIKEKNNVGDKNKKVKQKEPNIIYIEETLMEELGTKVDIKKGKKSGKIELHFSDDDELSRIINFISNKFS
jgi:ParB family chromosome partitioning protein